MKFLVIAFFIFFAYSNLLESKEIENIYQGGQCTNRVYGIEGSECTPGWNSTKTCKAFLACRNGKCIKAHVGASCSQDTDCFAYNPLYGGTRCVDKKCIKPRYNGLGCYDNKHCWSGVCSGGRCAGSPYGATCDPQKLSCDSGYYCSSESKRCELQKEEGAYCGDYFGSDRPDYELPHGTNYNVVCMGGLKCSGPTGSKYCIRWKAGYEGSPCNFWRDGDDSCRFGLTCSRRRGICYYEADEIESWRCNGSPRNCTYENEEECVCNERGVGSCQRVYDLVKCGFNEVSNRYRDCIEQNNCAYERSALTSMELNILDQETCIGKYCASDVLTTLCCAFKDFAAVPYTPSYMPPYCSTNNVGLTVFLVLFFICLFGICLAVAFAIIGGVVYYIMKNKGSGSFNITNDGEFQNLE